MTAPLAYNVHVRRSTIVGRPATELYREWRTPQRLAAFVHGAEPITVMDERRTRWAVRVPGLGWRTWASEVVEDRPDEVIRWRTIGETDLPHEMTVRFAPSADLASTVVTLEIRSSVLGGQITGALARLTGRSLEDHATVTLRNFKALMETGRVVTRDPGDRPEWRMSTGRKRMMAAILGAAAVSFVLVRRRQLRHHRRILGVRI